jgi:HK97 family phage portal protein
MAFFKSTPIETKAMPSNSDLYNNSFRLVTGADTIKNYAPADLLKFNRSYIYACNNKTAVTLASSPIKLYYKNTTSKQLKVKHSKIDKKQLDFIRKTTNNITIKQAEDIVEIEQHPFIDLINKINPRMNYVDFASLVQSYLGLIGNCFVLIEYTNGVPSALYPLLSENVTVLKKSTDTGYGEITGYKYSVDNKDIVYKAEDVIQFINYQPGNVLYGKGELESCISAAERLMYYDQLENYLNANNARPDFAVIYKGGIKEQEQKEISKSWFRKFGSAKNAGKPIVAGGDIDIKNLGFSPREMQYQSGRISAIKEIGACFGIPEAILELNSANLASSQSANQMYYQYTIIPKLSQYCEKMNEVLLPKYDPNIFCWFEEPKIEDPVSKAQVTNSYVASGVMTVNEAREQIGLEPLEETEQVTNGVNDEEQI